LENKKVSSVQYRTELPLVLSVIYTGGFITNIYKITRNNYKSLSKLPIKTGMIDGEVTELQKNFN
jgi:hypothetical protein